MIVDSSAIVAMVEQEGIARSLFAVIGQLPTVAMSAGTYVETCIVIDRRPDPMLARRLDAMLTNLAVRIEPVTETQARIARAAYRDFGKGSGHRAGLNFGDCFSYALAIDTDRPLLFVGNDFAHTDVRVARY